MNTSTRRAGHFFMRTAFVGLRPTDALVDELRAELPVRANVRIATTEPRRVVLLATKEAHCLGDLLLRHAEGDIPARIEAVISNYATLGTTGPIASTCRSTT
jgi:formyltetrahydrofolate deformylase